MNRRPGRVAPVCLAVLLIAACSDDDDPVAPSPHPVAVISPASVRTLPDEVVRFDPTGTHHTGGALHAQPYRWRTDGGDWSAWTSATDTVIAFAAGEHRVDLEVRDTEGRTDLAQAAVQTVVVAWSSPDELVESYTHAYRARDTYVVAGLLESTFRFVDDRGVWYGPDTEVLITGRILAGVTGVDLTLAPLGEWSEVVPGSYFSGLLQHSYALDLVYRRDDASDLAVHGTVVFFTASVDEGETWRLFGIQDLTDPDPTWSEAKRLDW